jgi:hypothetical protein
LEKGLFPIAVILFMPNPIQDPRLEIENRRPD